MEGQGEVEAGVNTVITQTGRHNQAGRHKQSGRQAGRREAGNRAGTIGGRQPGCNGEGDMLGRVTNDARITR